jgi:putative transposase
MILSLLQEAADAGAREEQACEVLGIEPRTVQRWRKEGIGEDKRQGPNTKPANALSEQEKVEVIAVANTPEHREMSPKQLVPKLADEGVYIASESSFYRILREATQMAHRGRAKAPQSRVAPTHVAYAPGQIWVWDITYLPTVVRGVFFYLYLILDLFSRKVVGWTVQPVESMVLSSELLNASIAHEEVDPTHLVVHADNGGPMKGSTMLATMQRLGIVASFSRPRVSDDNAFAEAFFRHLKYAPSWPNAPFASVEQAAAWVEKFVSWYNTEHRHSGIQFVTPADRHQGQDIAILEARKAVYEEAKRRHPERWSGETRDCEPVEEVALSPGQTTGAAVKNSRRRRRPPVAHSTTRHRAQGGSRTAQPASGTSESLTRPSTMAGRSVPSETSAKQAQTNGPNGAQL